jgi:hypothetical protein
VYRHITLQEACERMPRVRGGSNVRKQASRFSGDDEEEDDDE